MPDFPAQAKPRPLTRGDQLRDALGRLNALVGQLGYALEEEALNIPSLFDEVSAGLAELQAQGQDVRIYLAPCLFLQKLKQHFQTRKATPLARARTFQRCPPGEFLVTGDLPQAQHIGKIVWSLGGHGCFQYLSSS